MKLLLPLLSFALLVASATPQSASDDFNRPNNPSMGADWDESNGDLDIDANQAKFNSPWSNGFIYHTSMTGNYADSVSQMDFQINGFGGDPVASGTMKLSFSNNGDTADVEISSASGTASFNGSGILSFSFPITGNQFGIGGMGDSWVDNWSCSVGPQGPVLVVGGSCGTPGSAVLIVGATPGGQVALLSGAAGSYMHGGARCTGIQLGIAAPTIEVIVAADAAGAAIFQRNGRIPAAACGALTVQAVELATCLASNALAL